MNFSDMWQTWLKATTSPNDATFEELRQKPDATITTAIIWMAIYGAVSALAGIISGVMFAGAMNSMVPTLMSQMELPPAEAAQVEQALRIFSGGGFGMVGFSSLANIVMAPLFFLVGVGIYILDRQSVGRRRRIRPLRLSQCGLRGAAGHPDHVVGVGALRRLYQPADLDLLVGAGLFCDQSRTSSEQWPRHLGRADSGAGGGAALRLLYLQHRRPCGLVAESMSLSMPIDSADALSPEEQSDLPPDHRSGFVAVIGRPNVGKSTLLNRLLGQKIAITSPKPQTTRDQILGILTAADAQMLFLDTPGIHQPQHKLGEYMVQVAADTIADADVVIWLVDINTPPTTEDRAIAGLLQQLTTRKRKRVTLPPLILGCNQVDRWRGDAATTAERIREYTALLAWVRDLPPSVVPGRPPVSTAIFSAATGQGTHELLAQVRSLLPLGPRYYPEEQITNVDLRYMSAEIIREKALYLLQDEIPHSLAVEVDEFAERSETLTYISAVLYVERESQKAIVLGSGGSMIKRIGQTARPEIEGLVGTKVYLELWVKVWERWRKRQNLLKQLGYAVAR